MLKKVYDVEVIHVRDKEYWKVEKWYLLGILIYHKRTRAE